jgi:hypothetical protein
MKCCLKSSLSIGSSVNSLNFDIEMLINLFWYGLDGLRRHLVGRNHICRPYLEFVIRDHLDLIIVGSLVARYQLSGIIENSQKDF